MIDDYYKLKESFLKLKLNNNYLKINFFDNCGNFEKKHPKRDMAFFSAGDYKNLITYLLRKRAASTTKKDMTYIKEYLGFCEERLGIQLTKYDEILKFNNCNSAIDYVESLYDHSEDINDRISFEELLSLEKHVETEELSYQILLIVWLLFIGLTLDEVSALKIKDIHDWNIWYRRPVSLDDSIKTKVDYFIKKANSEQGIYRNSRSGNKILYEFKSKDYVIKNIQNGNNPVSNQKLDIDLDKVKYILNKKSFRSKNVRKSGMIYFGSKLIQSKNLKYVKDIIEQVYVPICSQFQEYEESYRITLNKLFRSNSEHSPLWVFYGIKVQDLSYAKFKQVTNIEPIQILKKMKLPIRRSNKKAVYEKNQETGESGEFFIYNWLRKEFDEDAYQVEDFYGYDVYAKINEVPRFIEIKTMTNLFCSINITRNEYRKAHKYSKNHWMYIYVKTENKVYVFKDLFELLGIKDKYKELYLVNDFKNIYHDNILIRSIRHVLNKCDESYPINLDNSVTRSYIEKSI